MRRSPFALVVLATAGALTGVVAFTASAGLRDDMAPASVVSMAAAIAAVLWLGRRPAFAAHTDRAPAGLRALFVVGSLAVAAQLAWLVPFIVDPGRAVWTSSAIGPMPSIHSCVSAYWLAGRAVDNAPNVYDEALYNLPQADPAAIRRARKLGRFNVDNYEYPPPFLLVPRALGAVTSDSGPSAGSGSRSISRWWPRRPSPSPGASTRPSAPAPCG